MPLRASSAAVSATAAPAAFLPWQGHSTRPPRGSHTRPSRFMRTDEAALRHCFAVPPMSSTAAEAAIAEATPTSAWQPPTAPATVAFLMAR